MAQPEIKNETIIVEPTAEEQPDESLPTTKDKVQQNDQQHFTK